MRYPGIFRVSGSAKRIRQVNCTHFIQYFSFHDDLSISPAYLTFKTQWSFIAERDVWERSTPWFLPGAAQRCCRSLEVLFAGASGASTHLWYVPQLYRCSWFGLCIWFNDNGIISWYLDLKSVEDQLLSLRLLCCLLPAINREILTELLDLLSHIAAEADNVWMIMSYESMHKLWHASKFQLFY